MNAATPEDRDRTTVWRSRAFVQPLLVTLLGIAAPPAILFAWASIGPPSDPCTGASCGPGYGIVAAIIRGLLISAGYMLIVGFVVGLSSRDSRLAWRAVLVALVILWVAASVVSAATRPTLGARELVDDLAGYGVFAVVLLIPIGLGFRVGRLVLNLRGP
jgi:hypothetical protein